MSTDVALSPNDTDVIFDLLKKDAVFIKETIFDCYSDRKIFLFQLFSTKNNKEICILQQIVPTNGKKLVHIYVNAKEQKWNLHKLQQLLDVVSAKSQKNTI